MVILTEGTSVPKHDIKLNLGIRLAISDVGFKSILIFLLSSKDTPVLSVTIDIIL